jgi:hypothetical protein
MSTLRRAAALAALLAAPLAAEDGATRAGALQISGAYAFAAGSAPTAAVYMSIANAGAEVDRLVAVEGAAARRLELHGHVHEDGIARMRALPEGIPLPPGETVELARGGLHVMLMGLAAPLEDGASIELTLVFERAGRATLVAPVELAAPAPAHGGHGD